MVNVFGKWILKMSCLGLALTLWAQDPRIEGPDLEPQVVKVLKTLASKAKVAGLTVLQKERTAVDQARVMYQALKRYQSQGKDGAEILQRQYGDVALAALDAFREYDPQGKDLAIEYMAFQIEETVKELRTLPVDDPRQRGFVYVMPLDYHLVEVDIRGLPDADTFRGILGETPGVRAELTLAPSQGQGRSCKNCYLIAIDKQP